MAKVKMSDLITGNEGSAYITVDGKNRLFFEVSKIEAEIEFNVISKKLLGSRLVQHKTVGAEGKGSMTIYNVSPTTSQIYSDYIKNGITPAISLQTTSEDAQSTIGKRTVVLRDVILAKAPVAYVEDGSEDLATTDIDFTFDEVDNLEEFSIPQNLR